MPEADVSEERIGTVDAVVFDLDDTLIDWWGSIRRCLGALADDDVVDALLAHCRAECWQVRPGTDGHVWHRNTWALHERRERLWPAALPWLEPDELATLMQRFHDQLWVGFFPDAVPTLDALVGRHRLAVMSNNHHLPAEVQRLGLHDWIDAAVVAPEPKPDPLGFLEVCDVLGTDPSRTAYVGDSVRADALGALESGLLPVWIDRWDDPWPDRPPTVRRISSLTELTGLVEPARPDPA